MTNPFVNYSAGVLPSNTSDAALTDYDGMNAMHAMMASPICLYLTVSTLAAVQARVNCTNASDDTIVCVSENCCILNLFFFLFPIPRLVALPWPIIGILPRHPDVALSQYGETHYLAMRRQQSYLDHLQQRRRVNEPSQFQVCIGVKLRELNCDFLPKLWRHLIFSCLLLFCRDVGISMFTRFFLGKLHLLQIAAATR